MSAGPSGGGDTDPDRLRSELELHRVFLEEIRELISVLRPDGTLAYVSPSLRRVLGFHQAEKLEVDALGEVHPEDRPRVEAAFRQIVADSAAERSLRYRVAHRAGGWRVLDTIAKNRLEDPAVGGVLVTSWDVTELERVQAALTLRAHELEERIKELDCLYRVGQVLANASQDWERSLEHAVAAIPSAFLKPDQTVACLWLDGRVHATRGFRRTKTSLSYPIRVGMERSGELEVCRLTPPPPGEPDFLPEERRLLVSIADRIAEAAWRNDATARLRRSEAYFRSLSQRAGVVIAVTDEEGRVRDVSESVRHLLGRAPDELVGRDTADLVVATDHDRVKGFVHAALEGADETVSGEVRVVDAAGQPKVVDVTLRNLLADPAVRGLVLTARDVTERVQQESHIRFQANLLDAVGQAILATDAEGRITYWNQAAEALYGWRRDEVLGRSVAEVRADLGNGAEETARALDELGQGVLRSAEIELRRKDGTSFPALVTDRPLLDDDGTSVGMIGVASDLTEHRDLEEQVRRSQRLEAIGRLAGGVAHDFNNLLTVIGGHCSLAAHGLPAESPHQPHLQQALDAVERAARLTSQLLAFSRRQYVDEQVFELDRALRSLQPLLRRLIPERIDLDFEVAGEPHHVRADPGQIEQVIVNLAVNAKDAIEREGRITFRLGPHAMEEAEAEAMPWEAKAGPYVRLTVEDTGSGIPDENLGKIFEPFFTTKPPGQGTGLGLSMIYGIVKRAGGHVLVEGRPGEGAHFHILLPAAAEAAPAPAPRAVPVAKPEEGPAQATVLLVEDEPSVRQLALHVLEQRGYRVLLAGNGREAVALAEAGAPFDLVVSDVVMPEMGALPMVERLREMRPDLRVVLMSGYPSEELPVDELGDHFVFLGKPFSPRQLATAVRQALDERTAAGH